MKVIVISNPYAGNKDIKVLHEQLAKYFSVSDLEIMETTRPLHAIELAKNAVKKNPDTIIAAGGDGTVIEVISGMINSDIKLGIIPFGTGNMLASNLGIPANLSKAIEIIFDNNTQKIDIGRINNRYFAFMAGCGFDAKIIDETSRERKRKYGLMAYIMEGFKQAFSPKHISFKIKLDDKKIIRTKALTVLIANSGNIIGKFFCIAPHASFIDGQFDVVVISPKNVYDYIPILWKIITRQNPKEPGKIHYYKARKIEISSKPALLVQADGDIIGRTPVSIQAMPASVEIITPKNSLLN